MAGSKIPRGQGRRRFVNWLLGTSLGGLLASVLYPIARYLVRPEPRPRPTA